MVILLSINVIKCIITISDVHSPYVPEVKSTSAHTIVLNIHCWIVSINKYLELMLKNKWIYYFFFSLYLHLGLILCGMAFHLPFKSYSSFFFCPLGCGVWPNQSHQWHFSLWFLAKFWQYPSGSSWVKFICHPSVILFSYKVQ